VEDMIVEIWTIFVKGGATSTHIKMVLMMSKTTLHVHY